MDQKNIRNFVIIAHIDHGKSTLADRLLEVTGTVEARRMRAQYLDQMDLERERGITIKMAPVRMEYAITNDHNYDHRDDEQDAKTESHSHGSSSSYILNLIDTPGHSDFAYEVSRALQAVEGAILLVDATKGIQAQTLSNFRAATRAGLSIVGAVNKIDVAGARIEETKSALSNLIGVSEEEILCVSGKTGEGVEALLHAVIEKTPPPRAEEGGGVTKALVFDSLYNDHKGILAYVRIMEGEVKSGETVRMYASGADCKLKEVGYFAPELKAATTLHAGEIGYLATGFKEPALVKIGDTITRARDARVDPLSGYREPAPVVFIAFYPDLDTQFEDLERAFMRLRLTDAALSFEPDANEALGRGLKVGFLGQLHFEITASRLSREFGLHFLTSFPSIAYRVKINGREQIIKEPHEFPEKPDEVWEPMIKIEILTPQHYLQKVLQLQEIFELAVENITTMGNYLLVTGTLPLSELIRDFDDRLKSISAGFASFSYELSGEKRTEAEKLEILVANEAVPALTRIVRTSDLEREARATVERLKHLLPQVQFAQAIQAKSQGRIIARETIAAMKKDVTGYLYGGDRTRKMKLWKKQKEGKERLKASGRVIISPEVFREILKK